MKFSDYNCQLQRTLLIDIIFVVSFRYYVIPVCSAKKVWTGTWTAARLAFRISINNFYPSILNPLSDRFVHDTSVQIWGPEPDAKNLRNGVNFIVDNQSCCSFERNFC